MVEILFAVALQYFTLCHEVNKNTHQKKRKQQIQFKEQLIGFILVYTKESNTIKKDICP